MVSENSCESVQKVTVRSNSALGLLTPSNTYATSRCFGTVKSVLVYGDIKYGRTLKIRFRVQRVQIMSLLSVGHLFLPLAIRSIEYLMHLFPQPDSDTETAVRHDK